MSKSRILIIDDSAEVRRSIEAALKAHDPQIEVISAADGMAGFKALMEGGVDLVLCDLVMPGLDGLKFLDLKRSRGEFQQIPVLLLTAMGEVGDKVAGLERGAQDYLVKPFDPRELIARVNAHVELKKIRDKLEEANALLKRLSTTDDLTGLYNRRYFFEALDREMDRAGRDRKSFALIACDLDRFKSVNDTFGHAEGDRVLKGTGELMLRHTRRYDTAARLGGEEFALLLPGTSLVDAAALAERLRATMESELRAGDRRAITLSAGLAIWRGGEETGAELLKRADEALYKAKAEGRNRVEIAT